MSSKWGEDECQGPPLKVIDPDFRDSTSCSSNHGLTSPWKRASCLIVISQLPCWLVYSKELYDALLLQFSRMVVLWRTLEIISSVHMILCWKKHTGKWSWVNKGQRVWPWAPKGYVPSSEQKVQISAQGHDVTLTPFLLHNMAEHWIGRERSPIYLANKLSSENLDVCRRSPGI